MRLWPVIFLMTACASDKSSEVDDVSVDDQSEVTTTDDGSDDIDVLDSDADGLTDEEEAALGTDPNLADSDGDGIDDGDEAGAGTDPTDEDSDDDGITDGAELEAGIDPADDDSDDDGMTDGAELEAGTDPTDDDSDDDGMTDGEEADAGTDPTDEDSDDDGMTDGEEIANETDPTDEDSDDDGMTDGEEAEAETDPNDSDSDDDGIDDGDEAEAETDPNDPDDVPESLVPLEGEWFLDLDNMTYVDDACNMQAVLTLAGMDIGELVPTNFDITDASSAGFSIEALNDYADCTLSGASFTCGGITMTESLSDAGYDAALDLEFSLYGTLTLESEMELGLDASVTNCTGTDCMIVQFLLPYPCTTVISAPSSM
jgi:hypothetical protein